MALMPTLNPSFNSFPLGLTDLIQQLTMPTSAPVQTTMVAPMIDPPVASGDFVNDFINNVRYTAAGKYYDQNHRMEPYAVDCSSLLGRALKSCNINVDPSMTTASMPAQLRKAGFIEMPFSNNNLQVGDIVWRDGHAEVYVGNGRTFGARGVGKPIGETNLFDANGNNVFRFSRIYRYGGG